MKFFMTGLIAALSLSCSPSVTEASDVQRPIAITHAVLIDGTGAPPIEDGTRRDRRRENSGGG